MISVRIPFLWPVFNVFTPIHVSVFHLFCLKFRSQVQLLGKIEVNVALAITWFGM